MSGKKLHRPYMSTSIVHMSVAYNNTGQVSTGHKAENGGNEFQQLSF